MEGKYFVPLLLFFLLPAFADEAPPVPSQSWPFQGMTGTFDRASLQRGFQVYKEVCAACHGLKQIHFRELQALGFSVDEIKALAATYEITDGPNDEGEMFQRKGRPSDRIPDPYKNENAARAANNGSFPPDLSLMIKARPDGANYVYALLTGFQDPPPAGVTLGPGMHYNRYFLGNQIAMAPPLSEGLVTFSDGTQATPAQMAHDVTTFLAWAAEPEMETRKAMGIRVLIFMSVFTVLMYFVMRRAWKRVS